MASSKYLIFIALTILYTIAIVGNAKKVKRNTSKPDRGYSVIARDPAKYLYFNFSSSNFTSTSRIRSLFTPVSNSGPVLFEAQVPYETPASNNAPASYNLQTSYLAPNSYRTPVSSRTQASYKAPAASYQTPISYESPSSYKAPAPYKAPTSYNYGDDDGSYWPGKYDKLGH